MNIEIGSLFTLITIGCTLYNAISNSKRINKKEISEELAEEEAQQC